MSILVSYFSAGEVETPLGQSVVEERYRALRRQVPIIYLVALVNLFGLQLGTTGDVAIGTNLPTALILFSVVRIVQWLRADKGQVSHAEMLARLRQTTYLAAGLCLFICAWCLHLSKTADPTSEMAITLFGSLTAIGTAYGLSSFPAAARLPLLVLAFPLAGKALFSDNPLFVGAAISLAVVSLLILRLLTVHNAQFIDLIRSRSIISIEQERAKASHRAALEASLTDFLTGLPNRRAFMDAVHRELLDRANRRKFAVAIVDLDRFKPINDTFGHATGDELLRIVADRLKSAVTSGAIVARLGGDEFAIIFPDVDHLSKAEVVGQRILVTVNQPAEINGRQYPVSACCGIALSRRGKLRTPTHVLAHADIALYQAKAEAAGRLGIFEARMEAPRQRRAKIERALQLPEIYQDIHVVFQPIFDLRTGQIIAQEALARWTDEDLGDVSPAEFVPIAEQLDVIGRLSDSLFETAVKEAVQWPAAVRLSFNLSSIQLCSEGSADSIIRALNEAGLSPDRLQVEVTETTLLADFEQARANLLKLRSAGVSIVLDDFGAGHASISHLREIRFDQIKLDGSLVRAAEECPERQRLLGAVIGLCQALDVPAVAEHVETEEQLKLLLELGCAAGQGYWLHRPMSSDAAREVSANLSFPHPPLAKRSRIAA